MDPYKVLEVNPASFTYDELKRNYKRLVMKYHPDKNTDIKSTPVFQTLTFCYKYLVKELRTREDSKDHTTLKSQAAAESGGSGQKNIHTTIDPKHFNVKNFNAMFDKHRYKDDVIEDGYGDWFKEDKTEDKGAIIHYKEPEALCTGFANVYELGATSIDDYSSDNMSNRNLNFMDLKKAYTTSRIVDEKHVESRPEFKSLEDIKKHRANISYVMSDADLRKYNANLEAEKKKEEARRTALRNKDSTIEGLYNRTHALMIGMFGKK